MRIVVNDIAAQKGGALTVLNEFYHCVRTHDTENEWIFLLGEPLLEETDNIKIITLPEIKHSRIKKLVFDLFTGKKFLKALKPDVVFSMQNTVVFGLGVPQVLYLHQSIPFQDIKKFSFFKKRERALAVYQHLIGCVIKKSVKSADKVIVQTKWMVEAVVKKCRVEREKVLQVFPAAPDIHPCDTDTAFRQNEFFYPSTPAIYKNNDVIFKACEILEKEGADFSVTLTIPQRYEKKNIRCTGRLPYAEVLKKYEESTLLFPSYIETVGFPMLEARKAGTVVLASDCPFSREVLEHYENAYFFDPFSPVELAALMRRVLSGEIQKKPVISEVPEKGDSWISVLNEVIRAGQMS